MSLPGTGTRSTWHYGILDALVAPIAATRAFTYPSYSVYCWQLHVMRMASSLVFRLEIERLVNLRAHMDRAWTGKPRVDRSVHAT